MTDRHLYMFALMPDTATTALIEQERVLFSGKYHSVKAFRSPVHLTLYQPFHSSVAIEQHIDPLAKWIGQQQSFDINLSDFGYFKTRKSPVLYIAVEPNDHLALLHHAFLDELGKYITVVHNDKPFTPHITIGYRDIDRSLFSAIREEYESRTFRAGFRVQDIFFWRHEGTQWKVFRKFPMHP